MASVTSFSEAVSKVGSRLMADYYVGSPQAPLTPSRMWITAGSIASDGSGSVLIVVEL